MEAVLSIAGAFAVEASDPSQVSAARLACQRLARSLDFDETRAGRLAIVTTEAMTNMVRHAGGGTLSVRPLAAGDALGIELLAIDAGPGMDSFAQSARDGVSTGGTAGTGLGAIQRLSDEFDVYTRPGAGSILRMALWNRDGAIPGSPYEVGAVCIAKAGETECGDAWAMQPHAHGATFLVADGLGHGPDARRAACTAVEVLRTHPEHSAIRLLDLAHGKLRATRGAAVAVMRHEAARAEVAFAGVGNIAAVILDGEGRRAMVSHNGIVGHNVHKSQEYCYPWPEGALLVAHSDGLESHWSLERFPGIRARHPSIIAGMLFRQHSRKRDDVTVLVVKTRS